MALTTEAFAEPRCRIEREADARLRLQVWAREMTTPQGLLIARAFHHGAWIESRGGAALEALFLVTLRQVGNPAYSNPHSPYWVHCSGGLIEDRNQDWTINGR